MKLNHFAVAGTLESSDIQIMVEPSSDGIEIQLDSSVIHQYGDEIKATITEVLKKLEVNNVKVVAKDQGALECTIKARVQTAILRASDVTENLPWGTKL